MSNEEEKFEKFVTSIRFDDRPSDAHRDQLEKQLLDAWEEQQTEIEAESDNITVEPIEPVGLYLRRLAIAASFLIVCGGLFWSIDSLFIGEQSYIARHPDRQAIERIIEAENATGVEKKQILAQIKDVWSLIDSKDSDALVAVLKTDDNAYTVRVWAAKYLGKFGSQDTLDMLEAAINHLGITNPKDPLMIAANKIRDRLGLEKPEKPQSDSPKTPKTNGSWQAAPDDCEPEMD